MRKKHLNKLKVNLHLKRVKRAYGKAKLLQDKQVFQLSEFPVKYGNDIS